MKKLKDSQQARKLGRYTFIGVAAFTSEYLTFVALTLAGLPLIAAQSLSFLCGLFVSFTGNRKITFNDAQAEYVHGGKSQLWRYATLALANLVLSNGVIFILVNNLAVSPLIAKLFVMVMVVAWNYLIFSKIIFRTK